MKTSTKNYEHELKWFNNLTSKNNESVSHVYYIQDIQTIEMLNKYFEDSGGEQKSAIWVDIDGLITKASIDCTKEGCNCSGSWSEEYCEHEEEDFYFNYEDLFNILSLRYKH